MEPSPSPAAAPTRRQRWMKIALRSLAVLGICLAIESLLPVPWQPSTYACIGMLRVYQKVGSPAAGAIGIRCRYQPTCSHYAEDAISHHGTLPGIAKSMGRLWRCSPWGGSGYDPAF